MEFPRGPGYWQFNQSLLQDKTFLQQTKQVMSEFFENNVGSANPQVVWDAAKCFFRGHCIKFSSWKKKQYLIKEKQLINEINILQTQIDNTTCPSPDQLDELACKQKLLESLYNERLNGILIRSKARWMELGERCTKYFINLVRRNYSRKNIQRLKRPSGEVIFNPQDILSDQVSFYSTLYSFEETPVPLTEANCDGFFPTNYSKRLSNDQQQACEGLINVDELKNAIFSFQSGKAPGLDGIPVDVYKELFDVFKGPMLQCFNYSFANGCLSDTQRQGLISLLLKKDNKGVDKDPTAITNWRPLTLLCCDTRILSKCIALRFKQVISDIIETDQTGFIKGRYIGDNIRRLLDTIEHYEDTGKPGLIFIADYKKAFDTLRWDFMFKCLDYFNFGPQLKTWVKVLYEKSISSVINNGYISNPFTLNRGVRQGCPLSPYLFVIAVEVLAIKIRSNHSIRGLNINGKCTKISQYADDSNFPFEPNLQTFYALLSDLERFSSISGLQLHAEKCKILRLGCLKFTNFCLPTHLPFQWVDGGVDVLGIHIPIDMDTLVNVNFEPRLERLDRLLRPWKGKTLSLYGKITVVNSLVVPQFTNLFQVLPSPNDLFFKIYERKVFSFIWEDGPERVARKVLYNLVENGGLKLINLRAFNLTMKASWVPKLFFHADWFTSFAIKVHPRLNLSLFPFMQLSSVQTLNYKGFLFEVLDAWYKFQHVEPATPADVRQQILWNNSNITVDNKSIFQTALFNRNIIFVNDLLDTDGNVMSYAEFCLVYPNSCEQFQYQQLISAIPKAWKTLLNIDHSKELVCLPRQYNHMWLRNIKINKLLYNFFLVHTNEVSIAHKVRLSWFYYFDRPIPWREVFTALSKCTIDPNARYFQYRLLYKFLPCNKVLKLWNLIESSTCSFCQSDEESYIHIFWECPHVISFWNNVQTWLKQEISLTLELNSFVVMFGDLSLSAPPLKNLIILLGKIFIFRSRRFKILNFQSFKTLTSVFQKTECLIASRRGKLEKHRGKWGTLCL